MSPALDDTPPFSIRRKFRAVFIAVATILLATCAVVWVQVADMQAGLDRVIEENREQMLARDLLGTLERLQEVLRGGVDSVEREESARELLGSALDNMGLFVRDEDGGGDPSREGHQQEENRIFEAIVADLRRLAETGQGQLKVDNALAVVSRAEQRARVLHDEIRHEVREASTDIQDHAFQMRLVVIGATATALLFLGLLWVVLDRIVKPLLALRDGARRIGRGELGLRIPESANDEIGQVTREFNEMAERLGQVHAHQEALVSERTRDFVRAARLADLGTLAAGIAHEINTPLGSIATCAEGLERRITNGSSNREDQLEYIGIISREAYRAHEILSRLLSFAGRGSGERAEFDMSRTVRETCLLLEGEQRARDVAIDSDVAPPGLRVVASEPEWKQILLNVLRNAIQATPAGGRVRLSCRQEAGVLTVVVEDDGCGIDPQDLDRIYDPFFTTKAPGEGTGLGLAIVHRIVEDAGGRITARNGERGARFEITMPGTEPVARESAESWR